MEIVKIAGVGAAIVLADKAVGESDWAKKAKADALAKDSTATGEPMEVFLARVAVAVGIVWAGKKFLGT